MNDATEQQVYFAEGHRADLNQSGEKSVAIARRSFPIYVTTREKAKEEARQYFQATEGPDWDGEVFVYDKNEAEARRQLGLWPLERG